MNENEVKSEEEQRTSEEGNVKPASPSGQQSSSLERDYVDVKLAHTRKMADYLKTAAKELQIQFDFLHNNLNMIHDKINPVDADFTLPVPANSQRKIAQDMVCAHRTIQDEERNVDIVQKALTQTNHETDSWNQELADIDLKIMNLTNSNRNLCASFNEYRKLY